jgi:ketosteroid isomerase-like protein
MALKFILALLAALVLTPPAAPAAESGPAAVMAIVNQFVDAFNRGDTKTAVAACASPASIIDEFAPHHWDGPNACADWARDLAAANKKAGVTGGIVTLARPWILNVTGDRNGNYAYVVIPASYTYRVHGTPAKELGSVFTLALKTTPAGWRIVAWSWSEH